MRRKRFHRTEIERDSGFLFIILAVMPVHPVNIEPSAPVASRPVSTRNRLTMPGGDEVSRRESAQAVWIIRALRHRFNFRKRQEGRPRRLNLRSGRKYSDARRTSGIAAAGASPLGSRGEYLGKAQGQSLDSPDPGSRVEHVERGAAEMRIAHTGQSLCRGGRTAERTGLLNAESSRCRTRPLPLRLRRVLAYPGGIKGCPGLRASNDHAARFMLFRIESDSRNRCSRAYEIEFFLNLDTWVRTNRSPRITSILRRRFDALVFRQNLDVRFHHRVRIVINLGF